MTYQEFQRQIKKDFAELKKRATAGVKNTAQRAIPIVRKHAPEAFRELRDSVHASNTATIVDAPHAEAVEVGSRPHYVPLEDLIKWVKLRGMQGINGHSNSHAHNIASQLQAMELHGSLSVDSPEDIARRIQSAILHNGTKPHWYAQASLPEIMEILDHEMKAVFT